MVAPRRNILGGHVGSSWIDESWVVLFESRRFSIPTAEEEEQAVGESLAKLIRGELTLLGCGARHAGIAYDMGMWRFDIIEDERLYKVDLNICDDEDGHCWRLNVWHSTRQQVDRCYGRADCCCRIDWALNLAGERLPWRRRIPTVGATHSVSESTSWRG